MGNQIALTKRERIELVRLLGELQTYLESLIDSYDAHGGKNTPDDQELIRDARRQWTRAEKWIKRLEQ
jgi:hypothetical protein